MEALIELDPHSDAQWSAYERDKTEERRVRGSVAKRCNCPPLYDAAGRRKACPRRHGSWSFIADVGDDPATGKRKQLKRGGFRTKEDAETALSTLLQQLQNHGWTDDKGRTVVEWMTSWLDRQEGTAALRPSTITMYRYYTDGRIKSSSRQHQTARPQATCRHGDDQSNGGDR